MLYLSQMIIYTGLMCLVYVLFLRNRPMHAFNRVYLITAAVLPILIPFIRFPETVSEQINSATAIGMRLPEFTVANAQQATVNNTLDLTWIIYAIVSLAVLSSLVYKWLKIKRVIRKHETSKEAGYTLVLNSGFGPGSWHKYIFLPTAEKNETIIRHELAHIQMHHTKDIILLMLLQAFFWPNLFLIWIRKELMQVHEFQADASTGMEKGAYAELLLSNVFDKCAIPAAHSFFMHPIRRRISMLRKEPRRFSRFVTVALSGIATLVVIISVVSIQSCKRKNWEVKKEENKVYTGWEIDEKNKNISATLGDTLKFAEKMPDFPGDSLAAFIKNNITYPQEAKDKKIEGRVSIMFVVGKDGSIYNPKVLRSPAEILSQEALRVVASMPKWIPGEQGGRKVAVYMTLPIQFKLN